MDPRTHSHAGTDGGASEADAAPPTVDHLRGAAAACLIATDDALLSSRRELELARAEAGADEVDPFTAALDQARHELDQALMAARSSQRSVDTDAERPQLEEILRRCEAVGVTLDALAPRFDALRDLEGRVGQMLAHLAADLTVMEGRLAVATGIVGTLTTQYPRATTAPVLDDLVEAAERLRFAHDSITVGEQLLASSDQEGAVTRMRAAEDALGQAGTMLDSVQRSPKVLVKAHEVVTTLLAQTERDIAEAERLGVTDDLAGQGQYARETLGWAGEEVASGEYDPLEMRRALQDTDVALGKALGPIRPADDTQDRAMALLGTTWYGARATIRAADEMIMTRCAAVGVEARVRLCEAREHHQAGTSLGDADPPAALWHLRSADALAYQARTLAQQDEASWRNARRMGAGTGDLDSMLLGGILIEPPGAPAEAGPTGPGGSHWPPLGPPSFGGPGTRARRVGNGNF